MATSKAIYYGFPTFGGCGVKVGRHEYVDEIDPDTMNRDFGSDDNDEATYSGVFRKVYATSKWRFKERRNMHLFANSRWPLHH